MNGLRIGNASCLLLAFLAGCNSVLGIEEATLDPGSGSFSSVQGPRPKASCDKPTTACEECRDHCQVDNCLEDSDCRDGLFSYRSCLDGNCSDSASPSCLDRFIDSSPESITFPGCMGACAGECEGMPFVSTCELYCSCLKQNCDVQYQELTKSESDEGAYEACVHGCEDANDLTLYGCRLLHCQYATPSAQHHCEHAMGREGQCESDPEEQPEHVCENKRISGWTCTSHDECCSEFCDTNNICR